MKHGTYYSWDPATRTAGDEKGLFVGHQQPWSSIDKPAPRHLVFVKQKLPSLDHSTAAEADGTCLKVWVEDVCG